MAAISSALLLAIAIVANQFKISTSVAESVSIVKFPARDIYSGQAFSLLCTVLASSRPLQVRWFNGSTMLADSDLVQISSPMNSQPNIATSLLDVSVAVAHTAWYYCEATVGGQRHFDSIRVTVKDTGSLTTVDMEISDSKLYSRVPFTISCLFKTPVAIPLQIKWTRNGAPIDDPFVTEVQYANTTTRGRLLVSESHPGTFEYSCIAEAVIDEYHLFEVAHSTPQLVIQGYPTPLLTIITEPSDGPFVNTEYTISCIVSSSTNQPLQLAWTCPKLLPTSDRLSLSKNISAVAATLTLSFSEVLPEDAGLYCCTAMVTVGQSRHQITKSAKISVAAPAQVVRVEMSRLPDIEQQWIAGRYAVLVCSVTMSKPTVIPDISWRNSTGPVHSNSTLIVGDTTLLSGAVWQSTLQFVSLQPHTQIYICNAAIKGKNRSVWSYVDIVQGLPSIFDPVITTNSLQAPLETGQSLSLFCSVEIPQELFTLSSLVWRRFSGVLAVNTTDKRVWPVVTNETHVTAKLEFLSLHLSDSGKYTCTAVYHIPGIAQQLDSTAAEYELILKAPEPEITLANTENIQDGLIQYTVTCRVALTQVAYLPLQLDIHWSIIEGTVSSVVPKDRLSAVRVHECNELYSQDFVIDQSSLASAITCQAILNVTNSYVTTTSVLATIVVADTITKVSVEAPTDQQVIEVGSYWAEVQWTSDRDALFRVMYGSVDGLNNTFTTSSIYSNKSTSSSTYTALLTDMNPGRMYWYKVLATIGDLSDSSVNHSLRTTEAAPVGSPVNLTVAQRNNGKVLFSWLPPNEEKQNGIITGYRLYCSPALAGSEIVSTERTQVELSSAALNSNYTCYVLAATRAGEGPPAVISFQFSSPVSGEIGQELPLTRVEFFILVFSLLFVFIGALLCVVVGACLVYRNKRKSLSRRYDTVMKASSSLYSVARSPLTFTNSRYVPSDEAERVWNNNANNGQQDESTRL